jgi:hypothetical protein
MFRVVLPPIISSAYNCIYSVWYLSHRYCYLAYGQFPLRLDYCRSPHAYVNQRLQRQLELLMMSGVPLETC